MSRDADIVSYLLGELDAGERASLDRRVAEDPAFAREVDRMRAVVTGLEEVPAAGWVREAPPLPQLPPRETEPAARRRRAPAFARPALAVAASLVILAAGIGIGAWIRGGDETPSGPAVALDRLGPAGAGAHGEARLADGGDRELVVDVSGLAPSTAGEFYELWLLDGPDRLVALGGFRVPASGAAQVAVPLPVPIHDFSYIDVSVEREDGDPGHSGRSVLRGPTTAI